MDKETKDRLQNMQLIETLIDGAEGVKSPLNNLTDRVCVLEKKQEKFEDALRDVTSAVTDNTQRLDTIVLGLSSLEVGQSEATQVNREAAEINRQILAIQQNVQAVGRVSSMIGGFVPWLIGTNEGRGLVLIALALYLGITHDFHKVKEWIAWLKW